MAPRKLADCYVGVKPFESALLGLLESQTVPPPSRTAHPSSTLTELDELPWAALHPVLHPSGAGVPAARAERKCWQLEALCTLVQLLAEDLRGHRHWAESVHVVAFAEGCGSLALPLAALLPWATVTIVELKQRSLDIARGRADDAGLLNVRYHCGDLTQFAEAFDVGVALHACGAASDLVLQACVRASARYVVCPCCTGKLSTDRRDWYRFAATGENGTRVAYPRSKAVASVLDAEAYNFLACAADVSDANLLDGARGLLRRLAKLYLEHDRSMWATEHGYDARLTRMPHGRKATPKCDILVGWPTDEPLGGRAAGALGVCAEDEDYAQAASLGVGMQCVEIEDESVDGGGKKGASAAPASRLGSALGASEWASEELDEMLSHLRQAVSAGPEGLDVCAITARKRRLVHFAAAELGLHHETRRDRKGVVVRNSVAVPG